MDLFIILGVVVLLTLIILGVLFFTLAKEEQKKEEEKIVPFLSTQAVQVPVEDELRAITQKADKQLDEAKQRIETLTKENESLKNQQANLEQAQQKLDKLQGEVSNLRAENVGLKTQLESTNEKVRLLEEEISRANATVSPPKPEPDEALRHELESLQYELIKAKAQTSGLERVSLNYKNQLEDFLKKVNVTQASNDQLSQGKNRLEGMLQEIKLQNEELVKKDQLAQFELEKNRSRLASLEREYEDFKARTQNNPK